MPPIQALQLQLQNLFKFSYPLSCCVVAPLEMKNAFTELRKAANHPFLRRVHYQTSLLTQMAKTLKNHVRILMMSVSGDVWGRNSAACTNHTVVWLMVEKIGKTQ